MQFERIGVRNELAARLPSALDADDENHFSGPVT